MPKTIGNPLTWLIRGTASAGSHVADGIDTMASHEDDVPPTVNTLTTDDIRDAIRLGFEDFSASRADVMFICVIYPVIGIVLAIAAFNTQLLPLLFPIAAGFAILGPFFAIGLYEISRRREKGEDVGWIVALETLRSPNIGAVMALGVFLMVIFITWLILADFLYGLTLGPEPPASALALLSDVFTTGAGWTMLIVGMAIGFVFALFVLATAVVSFPMVMDRHVGVPVAIATSLDVFRKNTRVILTWGLIIAVSLFVGSIPLFLGLIVVMPVLGHATWHLYRRAVS